MTVYSCSRCGFDHDNVPLLKLTNPFAPPEAMGLEWTHWAPCPTNGEPILIMVEFSNHGCNDLDLRPHFPDLWQRRSLLEEYCDGNGDPENYDPNDCNHTMDWAMMSFMAQFLRDYAKEES